MKRILAGITLLIALSGPALAQSPICGGISLVGEWVGGEEAASDLATADDIFDTEGQVPIAGHLVRMFTLSQDTDVRIDVSAIPAGDPYISVYDAAGVEVAADDDSAGDFGASVQTTLAEGTYCLAARSYESGVTDVSVKMGRGDQDFGTPAIPSAAAPIDSGGTGAGCFEPDTASLGTDLDIPGLTEGLSASNTAGSTPAYGFTLSEATPISVTASSEYGDPLIRLLDARHNVLAENDDFDGLNSRIDLTQMLEPGDYCIEIEDLNGNENLITVGLETFDPAADRLRRLNAAEFAPTAGDSVTITDLGTLDTAILQEVQTSSDATWYRLELPAGGLLLTEVIGNGLDPEVVLFDRVGRRIGENDDGPDGLDSFLVSRLLPGSYTVAIRLVGDGETGPVRLLMERYVLAQ